MNIPLFHVGGSSSNGIFAGNLSMMSGGGLKSTQEKMQRQQKTAGQIEFWEQQKANLKNMEGSTLEEIARKLEMFHSYEDEIAEEISESAKTLTQEMQEEFNEKMAENAKEAAVFAEDQQALSEQALAGEKAAALYKRFDIRI